jgi:hypothetical protein
MTWQDAIRQDPEARRDFIAYVSNQIASGFQEMDCAVQDESHPRLYAAKGKKDAFVELKTAFELDELEAAGHADFRRAAAGR